MTHNQNTAFKARFDSLGSKFNGKSLDDYVNGKSFCCSGNSLDEIEKNNTQTAENAKLEDNLYFYHSDHLGSTSMVTNYDGEVTQNVAYIPYGEVFVDEHTTTYENPFKFSGKELDDVTGLYDHGARSRNPITTVWLGVDPMFEKYVGMSPYNYCAGNPVKLVDPDGEAFWAVGAAIGGAIVGATVSGVIAALDPDKNATEVIAATVGGAVSGAIAAGGASVGAAMVSGAAGAAGNAVEQSINIFFGNQEEFDVKSTAIAAGTGAVCNAGSKYVGKIIDNSAKKTEEKILESAEEKKISIRPSSDYKQTQRNAQKNNTTPQAEMLKQVKNKRKEIEYKKRNALSENNTRKYIRNRKSDALFSTTQNVSQGWVEESVKKQQ